MPKPCTWPAGAALLVIAILVDVLELNFQVLVQIPVQDDVGAIQDTALDRAVVQVQVVKAGRDFPGARAGGPTTVVTTGQPEWRRRAIEVVGGDAAEATIIGAVFAGQEVTSLDVTAVISQCARLDAANGRVVHLSEAPLGQQREWSAVVEEFGANDRGRVCRDGPVSTRRDELPGSVTPLTVLPKSPMASRKPGRARKRITSGPAIPGSGLPPSGRWRTHPDAGSKRRLPSSTAMR